MSPIPRRILFVTFHDPRGSHIGSIRVRKFSEDLTRLGCDVRVLSRAGAEAPGDWQERDTREPLRSVGKRRLSRKVLSWIYSHGLAIPDRTVRFLPQMFMAARNLAPWRPEVIVASIPPFSPILVGRRLAKRWGVPWTIDYRDLWTASNYYELGPSRRRIDRMIERRLIASANLTTTVSSVWADDMVRSFGVRPEVISNGYDPDEAVGRAPLPPKTGLPLRIVYTGEIYEGKRDPSPLFEVVRDAEFGPDELQIHFWGQRLQVVSELAARHAVDHIVSVNPPVERPVSLGLQRSADVLLLLMWNDPREAGMHTGKIYEYLAARRPVLMLGYEDGVAANLLRERAAGVVANDSEAIWRALKEWIDQLRSQGCLPTLPTSVPHGLTRGEQAAKFLELLQGLDPTSRPVKGLH